ncbi:acyl-CoA thioesterase [Pseudomonas sp. V1]|uniref:acyl-CoA thioesterase n=1 Tax=Pseudomonas arcuscaelestis TaxID=2710591 RepID=UPI00193FAD48|nr:thioesterase family protein [Pseudomonas arcuscaelestis]MBM3103952.1 acyl-CoA thioesterase [Pseudomonas arcuscaelestis]
MSKPVPNARSAYRYLREITTRWMDNDVYGHVNNVIYYSWFDTVVNGWLLEQGLLDFEQCPTVGLVVDTHCSYFSSIAFPDLVRAGLRVSRLGGSSVCYEVGLFANDSTEASAQGHFVHVYVDRTTRRPVPLPPALRHALETLMLASAHPTGVGTRTG